MLILKRALKKEAAAYLADGHDLNEWAMHVVTEPSDELITAMQSVDIEDDEEFEDMLDELIVETFNYYATEQLEKN